LKGIWKPIELIAFNDPILIDFYPQVCNEKNGVFNIISSAHLLSNSETQCHVTISIPEISSKIIKSSTFKLIKGDNHISIQLEVNSNLIDLW